jgi:hypothetical protein
VTERRCLACHGFGDYQPVKTNLAKDSPLRFAPDLLLAMEKLDLDYFVAFTRDPEYLQPGAAMPGLRLTEAELEEVRRFTVAVKGAISRGEIRPVHTHYEMKKK